MSQENIDITKEEPILPGALVQFHRATSSGSSENIYGVGDMSLALHRPGHEWPWVDLGRIQYATPTPEQYLDAQTSPQFSEGSKAHADIHRRLSKKQAALVVKKINEMIVREFPNGIPPDDEITLR